MEKKYKKGKGSRKGIFAISVFILSLSVILTACSKGKVSDSTTTPNQAADSANPFAKKLDITWMGHNPPGKVWDAMEDNPTKKMIEDKFNVRITMVPIDIFNKEQLNLYFADGKTADYIRINNAPDVTMLEDQGLLKEIPEDLIRKNMPNWMKSVESMVDPKIVKSTMYYKGKIYGVPFINYSALQPFVTGIRKDWLDNVGITKFPETIDEYHEVLKRFTFNDPDKNGKNDTYGGHGTQLYLKGAFGIGAPDINYYADKDGKVYSTATSDNYKEYLRVLASWYKEGLIDPESLTDQRPQERAKWSDSKFGVLADHPWWFAQSTAGNLTQMLLDKNPNAKIAFFKPFAGPNGQMATGNVGFPSMQFGFGFGKDTSEEKIERIMAIKDYLAANDDFWTKAVYGEEGKGYTRDANGIIQVTKEYLSVDKLVQEGLGQYFALRPDTWDYQKKNVVNKSDLPAYDLAMSSPVVYNNVNFAYSGTNEANAKYGAAVSTIVSEFQTNVLTGKVDLDKEWDSFKKKYLDAGGKAITDDYQKLYDASNKK